MALPSPGFSPSSGQRVDQGTTQKGRVPVEPEPIDYWRNPIRPAASPVDTYIRPGSPEKSPLWQLAESLGTLDKSIDGYFSATKAKYAEDAKLQEEANQWRAAGPQDQGGSGADGQAVQQGLIPPQASPSFTSRGGAVTGILAGEELEGKYQVAYQNWPGKDSGDPQQFNQFVRGFISNNIGTTDPTILKTLLPKVHAIVGQGYNQWQKDLANSTYGRQVQGETALMAQNIDGHFATATDTGTQTADYGAVTQTLMDQRRAATQAGMKQDDFDNELVKTVTAKAIERSDPNLLKVLDAQVPDRNYKYTDLANVKKGVTDTTRLIDAHVRAQEEQARKVQDREDKTKLNAITTPVVESITKNPAAPIPEEVLQAGATLDPEFRLKVLKWQDQAMASQGKDDPRVITSVYETMFRNPLQAQEVFRQAMDRNVFANRESIKDAHALAVKLSDEQTQNVLKGGTFSAIKESIRSRTSPNKVEAFFNPDKWSDTGTAAWTEYQQAMVAWSGANPKAGPADIIKAQADIGKAVLDRIQGTGEAAQFTPLPRQLELPDNAFAPNRPGTTVAPGGQIPRSGDTPLPPPKPQALAPPAPPNPEAQTWYGTLTPQQQTIIQQVGEKTGKPLDAVVNELFQKQQAAPAAAPAPAAPAGQTNAEPLSPAQQAFNSGNFLEAAKHYAAQSPHPAQTDINSGDLGRGLIKYFLGQQQQQQQPPAPIPQVRPATPAPTDKRSELPQDLRDTVTRSVLGLRPDQPVPQEASLPSGEVAASRVAQIDKSPVRGLVEKVAGQTGMDPSLLKTIVSIESGGRPTATTGSYHGLLQLSRHEFATFGDGGDIHNPEDNLLAGVRSLQAKSQAFARDFGRAPTAVELYLMHQQGEAGLRAHEKNPDQPAWRSMLQTGEGRQKGESWAKSAIWGNVPTDFKRRFGSVDNVTSRDFIAMWASKLHGVPFRPNSLATTEGDTNG